jgi:hypothetical protein
MRGCSGLSPDPIVDAELGEVGKMAATTVANGLKPGRSNDLHRPPLVSCGENLGALAVVGGGLG